MRAFFIYLLFAIIGAQCFAQTENEMADSAQYIDTVYVYSNWKSIMTHEPVAAFSGQIVYENNPLETEIYTSEPESQFIVDNQAVAINIGDSLWLANADYLNKVFKNKHEWFSNFIPLYFTEKIAFVKFWNDYPSEPRMRAMPDKSVKIVNNYYCQSSFFIIDFIGRQLVELNYKVLTSLLARYPDLQCRYLGMKKYKERDVVDFFFMQYIDRLNKDDDALTIIEQLELH